MGNIEKGYKFEVSGYIVLKTNDFIPFKTVTPFVSDGYEAKDYVINKIKRLNSSGCIINNENVKLIIE